MCILYAIQQRFGRMVCKQDIAAFYAHLGTKLGGKIRATFKNMRKKRHFFNSQNAVSYAALPADL